LTLNEDTTMPSTHAVLLAGALFTAKITIFSFVQRAEIHKFRAGIKLFL